MNCVEINSSFYRPHQQKTYERWAASTPKGFRFSVKVPKLLTHDQRLPIPDRCSIVSLTKSPASATSSAPSSSSCRPACSSTRTARPTSSRPWPSASSPRPSASPSSQLVHTRGRRMARRTPHRPRRSRSGPRPRRIRTRRLARPHLHPPARLAADVLLGLRTALHHRARTPP